MNATISYSHFHGHGHDIGCHHGHTSDGCGHGYKENLKLTFYH